MDTVCLITIIGTLASIGGGIVAVWQAKRSKKSADYAERVEKQLTRYDKISELTQLNVACKRAQQSMEKYGPASKPSNLRGVSGENDAKNVQDFLLLLRENRLHFGSKKQNEADQFYETINPLLEKFTRSKTNEQLINSGKPVLLHLNSMLSIIKKKQSDSKKSV